MMRPMKNSPRMFSRQVVGLLLAALAVPAILLPQAAEAPLPVRVSEIMTRFPAASGVDRDKAAAELMALGEPALLDLGSRLVETGAGDDSLVRYAIHGVAVYAARQGAEPERALLSGALVKALRSAKDAEPKAFLLSQLQLIGRDEAVSAIAEYLADPRLADPAARALSSIGGGAAEKALIGVLTSPLGAVPIPIIQALGVLRSRPAVPALLALLKDAGSELRASVLSSLAEIGDAAARSALETISVSLTGRERLAAASLYLRFAERVIENGDRDLGMKIIRDILSGYTATDESPVRSKALDLLGREMGEAVLPELLTAAGSEDRAFRRKALAMAETLQSAGALPWLSAAAYMPPDNQSDIFAMLAHRGEKAALPFIREKLGSAEKPLRLAAIEALARLRGIDAADELWPFFDSGDEAQVRVMKEVALGWPTETVVPRLVSAAAGFSPAAQKAALEIFADRQAQNASGVVLALVASPEEGVRVAALAALEMTAGPKDLPALLGLMSKADGPKIIVPLQNAVVAASNRIPEPERRAEAVLAALKKIKAARRADFLRPLARIGGVKALQFVIAETRSKNAAAQAAALSVLSSWPDGSALSELFKLASSKEKKPRYLALQGIARLLGDVSGPQDRLAQWRRAFDLAIQDDERGLLVSGLGAIREAEALKTAASFLNRPGLQTKAAEAAVRIAMPAPGAAGLTGFETALALRGALPSVENDYDREQAEKYAWKLLLDAGFTAAFNGKDLSGWKGLVADPPQRSRLMPEESAKARADADDLMRKHWRVIDGMLAFDGRGHSLCTAKDYADFEMFVDWKIEPQGDSGIYLRGSPQVQIWDPAQWPEGSGGLYNNQKNPAKPAVKADRPIGEWNTFYIKMAGERVTVILNGVLVVDDVIMENYWEREKPIYPAGQIELQAHSTPLYFKNIFIRERPADGEVRAASVLADEERTAGFVPLFNGRDLSGWTGDTKGYVVENGTLVVVPESGGNLYTEAEYTDFNLRFEFKLTTGANNGIGIRGPLTGDAAYMGMEIQVLDDSADQYKALQPYQYHGSIYGVVPSKRGFQKPVGEWNVEEIIARGRRITVKLNGATIVDADLDQASTPVTLDGRDHPGLMRDGGYISFCGHGSRVEFRNLRILDLTGRR